MEIGQKSAIKYRCFDFIGKLYEDFKNLTNFNRTFTARYGNTLNSVNSSSG